MVTRLDHGTIEAQQPARQARIPGQRLYLQQMRGLSALGAGAAFLPMMLTGAALTPVSARLAEKLGARPLIIGRLRGR